MSFEDQVAELKEQLDEARNENEKLRLELGQTEDRIKELEKELNSDIDALAVIVGYMRRVI